MQYFSTGCFSFNPVSCRTLKNPFTPCYSGRSDPNRGEAIRNLRVWSVQYYGLGAKAEASKRPSAVKVDDAENPVMTAG